MTIAGSDHYSASLSGNITLLGDLEMTGGGTGVLGLTITMASENNQSIFNTTSGSIPNLTVNKSSGTVIFLSNVIVIGDWEWISGDLDMGEWALEIESRKSPYNSFVPGDVEYTKLKFEEVPYNPIVIEQEVSVQELLTITGSDHYSCPLNGGPINLKGNLLLTGGGNGDVVINFTGSANQTITQTVGIAPSMAFNKSGGIVKLESDLVLQPSASWTWNSGVLNAQTHKIKLDGGKHTFKAGGQEYYQVEIELGTGITTITDTLTISNKLIVSGSTHSSAVLVGEVNLYGDLEVLGGKSGVGTSYTINFLGTEEQSITNNNGYLSNVVVNKSSGELVFSSDISVSGNWNFIQGTLNSCNFTLQFVGSVDPQSFFPGNAFYYRVDINKYAEDDDVGLEGNLKVSGELSLSNGIFINSSNSTITTKNFIQTGGTVNLGFGAMKVTGDFTRTGGTFTAGTSVVALQGKNQTINVTGAPTTFYKLYKLVNSADTLTITAGNTITIASGGVIRLWGKYEDAYSNPATLSVRSSSPGTQYNLTLTGSAEMEYIDIQDANFSTAVTAAASVDSGNNTNLTVTKEFISTIRASGGDYTTLSAWEAAVNCDLTAASTKVFSHSGITGTMPDNSSVTGATSGATATLVHATSSQILLKDISGTFQSGEQVQIDGSNYVTITDDGYGAIATAHPYNDWPEGLDDRVTIDGWTTDDRHYPKIYVPVSERHRGKLKNTSGEYSGFTMLETVYQATCIYNYANYLVVDGVAMDVLHSSRGKGILSGGNYCRFRNVLLNSPKAWGATMDGIQLSVSNETQYIANSLISKSEGTYIIPYNLGRRGNVFAYNCSAVQNLGPKGFYIREDLSNNHVRIKNNFSEAATQKDFVRESGIGTITAQNNASSDATADDFGGTGNRINQTFTFADEANDDFHLADTDTGAKGYGTDLSIDPDFPVIDDIDGAPRPVWDAWDIGADQTPRKIYRSVGPGNTSALASGTSNEMVIASDWAIFSSPLPDNVGVGDAIQYDSDDDGAIDSIAFISERISSSYYRVQDYLGFTPNQTSTADTDWAIYRAYTSLANAESGNENDGIDDAVENFDDWTAGGAKDADEGGRDLTVDDVQWNIACYKDAVDTSSVLINGWTTSAQNYLKIYTPVSSSEVGESQRHTGKTGTGYKLSSSSYPFVLYDNYQWIDGLEISSATNPSFYVSSTGSKEFKISNNLINNLNDTNIYINSGDNIFKIWNNVFYTSNHGIFSFGTRKAYVYNNTFIYAGSTPNDYTAVYGGANTIAINNIAQGAFGVDGGGGYKCFTGTFNATSDYNISSDNSAPGSHSIHSATVLFRSLADYDFHLAPNDSTAKNAGVDLSNDPYLPFTTDIDGETRQGSWNIGADETLNQSIRMGGKVRMRGVRLGQ